VIPNELVGTAKVPGGGELRCWRHDGDFSIRIDGIELMSNRVHGSEEAMAELAIERLGSRRNPRVLVGGLGMGFTLARTLQLVGEESIVDVAEVVPEIVQWNRELFGHCAGHPLKDPRTRLHMGDVNSRIAAVNGLYDVMLLDVDNGPDGLVRGDNDRIYSRRGLDRAWTAMRPGSVLAVWSSRSDDRFADRLTRGGFTVTEHRVRARRTKGPVRTIWIAWRR
jgi:spermidine synthase